jgi:hypothetical protein
VFVTNEPECGVCFSLPGVAVTADACRCALAELVRLIWQSRLYKKKDCESRISKIADRCSQESPDSKLTRGN